MSVTTETVFETVIDRLQGVAHALCQREEQQSKELRKQRRNRLEVPCSVRILSRSANESETVAGVIFNVSAGGVGLLTTTALSRSQPLEVTMFVSGRPKLYLGGTVSFCQALPEGDVYQVGVQIIDKSETPLITDDPWSLRRMLEWADELL